MRRLPTGCLVISLAAGFVSITSVSARAEQIVAMDDGQGHKIYVNAEEAIYTSRGGSSTRTLGPPAEIDRLVDQTSRQYQVDPDLVRAIIQVESDYNPQAVSSKGAMGLMQLIPSTAVRFGVQNPFNARQNINGGVNYLRYLLNLFDGDVTLSVAAYNAGEHSVLRQGGVPRISETEKYVRKVKNLYDPTSASLPRSTKRKQSDKEPIYRYVDAYGVVHFTNGDDL